MIHALVVGSAGVLNRLRAASPEIVARVKPTMYRLAIMLQRKVKTEKLSGQVLHVRSGTLRRSISQRVTVEGGLLTGVVGTNLKYGRVHEYGGRVSIREHVRKSRIGTIYTVRQHDRTFPERSFLRSSLAELLPTIRKELQVAARQSIKAVLKP